MVFRGSSHLPFIAARTSSVNLRCERSRSATRSGDPELSDEPESFALKPVQGGIGLIVTNPRSLGRVLALFSEDAEYGPDGPHGRHHLIVECIVFHRTIGVIHGLPSPGCRGSDGEGLLLRSSLLAHGHPGGGPLVSPRTS